MYEFRRVCSCATPAYDLLAKVRACIRNLKAPAGEAEAADRSREKQAAAVALRKVVTSDSMFPSFPSLLLHLQLDFHSRCPVFAPQQAHYYLGTLGTARTVLDSAERQLWLSSCPR
jgi:hypothetical protein